jgi:hypothetical protein
MMTSVIGNLAWSFLVIMHLYTREGMASKTKLTLAEGKINVKLYVKFLPNFFFLHDDWPCY